MQKRIWSSGKLLNAKGELETKGYATSLLLEYNRRDIKAHPLCVKEWDYYLIHNDKYAVALTIADNSYMGLLSVSFIDFQVPWYKTASVMKAFPLGGMGLPGTSGTGDISYSNDRISLSFKHITDGKRELSCRMNRFLKRDSFSCKLILSEEPDESMVIATPFPGKPKAFYYNQKINCMKAEGYAVIGHKKYSFDKENSFATLDWGRGVWPYRNTWYWGSASGEIEGSAFGFNIGYGFGDTSAATENMLFYKGKAHKLDKVQFHIPKSGDAYSYMDPWTFSSNEERLMLDFQPILDRRDHSSIGIISSKQHQVFGRFTGKAVLDGGEQLEIKDFLGFAERVENKW
ncbi:DUF2804 domain-containing protein [Bacillus sp. 1P06AnD]|uniref:DUF2804 domain-containing protein n=1 Tax=Bacillus sp. 1P06AnD TaxID=3132208 RepID=UPI0039A31FCC